MPIKFESTKPQISSSPKQLYNASPEKTAPAMSTLTKSPQKEEKFSVSKSFANNFWGPNNQGFEAILERMRIACVTCEELRAFYKERIEIEEEYAKKLIRLSKTVIGQKECGQVRQSLQALTHETDAYAKGRLEFVAQMKAQLDDGLATFLMQLKERKKPVEHSIEHVHKQKLSLAAQLDKNQKKYEADCHKINAYMAQANMLLGRELERNNAKLEKTQISAEKSNREYQASVRLYKDINDRWVQEWKTACDKFQDMDEERIDFIKANVWNYANLYSTVCVNDDESCERVRQALETIDVEKEIIQFINENETSQEIPEAPKYINFYRKENEQPEDPYRVAQFPREAQPQYHSSETHEKSQIYSNSPPAADQYNPTIDAMSRMSIDALNTQQNNLSSPNLASQRPQMMMDKRKSMGPMYDSAAMNGYKSNQGMYPQMGQQQHMGQPDMYEKQLPPSIRPNNNGYANSRPVSLGPPGSGYGLMGYQHPNVQQQQQQQQQQQDMALRQRSNQQSSFPAYAHGNQSARSAAKQGPVQYTTDGIEILGYVRAMYDYTAAIPEEISFHKGDTLMVLRTQEDGWWEGEVVGARRSRRGLFPSNYVRNVK